MILLFVDKQLFKMLNPIQTFKYCYSNRKEMEKRMETIISLPKSTISTIYSKQNIIPYRQSPQSTVRFVKSQSIHPPQSHFVQNTWTTTASPFLQPRVLSPRQIVSPIQPTSIRRADFIELGGSKEKTICSQRDQTIYLTQSRKTQAPLSDNFLRKIGILEGRIRQLHKEKQEISADLNQKIKIMQLENSKLTSIIKGHKTQIETAVSTLNTQRSITTEQEEFNIEQMLSSQITINLQLREENQKLKAEVNKLNGQVERLSNQKNSLQTLNVEFKKAHEQELKKVELEKITCLNQTRAGLEEKIVELEQSILKRQSAFEELVQEKEKRILELQEEIYSLNVSIQQKDRQNRSLDEEISMIQLELANKRQQLTSKIQEAEALKDKKNELETKQGCKKCKQLTHTVFRLNTQLNKK